MVNKPVVVLKIHWQLLSDIFTCKKTMNRITCIRQTINGSLTTAASAVRIPTDRSSH